LVDRRAILAGVYNTLASGRLHFLTPSPFRKPLPGGNLTKKNNADAGFSSQAH
jgi:hypothetical protein